MWEASESTTLDEAGVNEGRSYPTECRAREQWPLITPLAGAEGDNQRSAGAQRASEHHQRQRQEVRLMSCGAPKPALPQAGAAGGEAHRLQPYAPGSRGCNPANPGCNPV